MNSEKRGLLLAPVVDGQVHPLSLAGSELGGIYWNRIYVVGDILEKILNRLRILYAVLPYVLYFVIT